jgi:hypothetical protein
MSQTSGSVGHKHAQVHGGNSWVTIDRFMYRFMYGFAGGGLRVGRGDRGAVGSGHRGCGR